MTLFFLQIRAKDSDANRSCTLYFMTNEPVFFLQNLLFFKNASRKIVDTVNSLIERIIGSGISIRASTVLLLVVNSAT